MEKLFIDLVLKKDFEPVRVDIRFHKDFLYLLSFYPKTYLDKFLSKNTVSKRLLDSYEQREIKTRPSYCLYLGYLDKNVIEENLILNDFTREDEQTPDILFSDLKGRTDVTNYNNIISVFKSNIKTNLSNKVYMHDFLSHTDYIAKSISVKRGYNYSNYINKNKIYIFKPVKGFSGRGIHIIKNYDDFLRSFLSLGLKDETVLSEYIKSPMLINNKKFHLRIYFLVVITPFSKKFFMYKIGKVIFAKKEYIQDDWYNELIHDTHQRHSGEYFLDDFKEIDKDIISQIQDVLKELSKNDQYDKYEESLGAFEIFGCDFMIDENKKVKILEMNSKVDYSTINTKRRQRLNKELVLGLLQAIFDFKQYDYLYPL